MKKVLAIFVFLVLLTAGIVAQTRVSNPSETSNVRYPSQILNLTNWKLTLPQGPSETPTEIKQPQLAKYVNNPWFMPSLEENGVRFRAPVNGVTTSGSHYPRTELREMFNSGEDKASWSSTSGTHVMTLTEAVTAVPRTKKHVVTAQIHDDREDIIMIRLEYPKLYVTARSDKLFLLDGDYKLGKKFTVRMEVAGGKTNIYYNNSKKPVYTYTNIYTNSYFKAGVYTQSNCQREVVPWLCNDSNYGEVVVYSLNIAHK